MRFLLSLAVNHYFLRLFHFERVSFPLANLSCEDLSQMFGNQSPVICFYPLTLVTFGPNTDLPFMNSNDEVLLISLFEDRSTTLTGHSGKLIIDSLLVWSNLDKSPCCSKAVLIDGLTAIFFNHETSWVSMYLKARFVIKFQVTVVRAERNEPCHLRHLVL
jgi:hypothetical protein